MKGKGLTQPFTQGTYGKAGRKPFISRSQRPPQLFSLPLGNSHNLDMIFLPNFRQHLLTKSPHPLQFMELMQTAGEKEEEAPVVQGIGGFHHFSAGAQLR